MRLKDINVIKPIKEILKSSIFHLILFLNLQRYMRFQLISIKLQWTLEKPLESPFIFLFMDAATKKLSKIF